MLECENTQKPNRIWITTIWDVNPVAQPGANYGRMFALGEYLSQKGYDVTIWFTTFDHPSKKHIKPRDAVAQINENEKIVLLHSPIVYKRNMSPIRLLYDTIIACKMKHYIKNKEEYPVPDLIFCSYPTEQYCRVALDYGRKNNIPVIMDARDQWPDIFERAFPKAIRFLSKPVLSPLKYMTAKDFSKAQAICAMSSVNLEWALNYAKRQKNNNDTCIFISSYKGILESKILTDQLETWMKLGITNETWNVCLFSSLSLATQDFDTVIDAIEKVHKKYVQIRFIIGGKGEGEEYLRKKTENLSFIRVMGWMNNEQMCSLMSISKVGMLCYKNTLDYKDAWGNKVGQYLSYGLPILTSARGISKSYVEQWQCGLAYEEGNSQQLAEVFSNLIENPEKIQKMSNNAVARFLEDFDRQVVVKKFEEMIVNVANDYRKLGEIK